MELTKQDVDRKFTKVKTLSYQLWLRKTLTNSVFKAVERLKCVSQPNCRGLPYFPTPMSRNHNHLHWRTIHKYVRIINSVCSDRFQWQLAWITRDERGRGFLLTTAITLFFGAAETHGFSERNNLGSAFTVCFLKVKIESTAIICKLCKSLSTMIDSFATNKWIKWTNKINSWDVGLLAVAQPLLVHCFQVTLK